MRANASASKQTHPWPRQHVRKQANASASAVHVSISFLFVSIHKSCAPSHASASARRQMRPLLRYTISFFPVSFVSLTFYFPAYEHCPPPPNPIILIIHVAIHVVVRDHNILFLCFSYWCARSAGHQSTVILIRL